MKFKLAISVAVVAVIAITAFAQTFPTTEKIRQTDTFNDVKRKLVQANVTIADLSTVASAGGVVAISKGGTGATNAAGARAALGFGEYLTNTASGLRTAISIGEYHTNTADNLKKAIGIQAGSAVTADDGTVTNTFSTAFSTAPKVVLTPFNSTTALTNTVVSVTTSNFVANLGANAVTLHWVAVGAP